MNTDEFLVAEYRFFAESFWKNEELGERRVNFFITLATAAAAAMVALVTSDQENLSDNDVRGIATIALLAILTYGACTYLRMLRRNQVTDEYKDIINHLRQLISARLLGLSSYYLPFRPPSPRLLRGGLADTVGIMNAFLVLVTSALWLPWIWACGTSIAALIVFLAPQALLLKRSRSGPPPQVFRAGVGALICRSDGSVLGLARRDVPNAWQLPQGGLEAGEEPIEAVKREILEETGIERGLEQLSAEPQLLVYELPEAHRSPKTGRGQAQYWYVFCYSGPDYAITLGDRREFKSWKWMRMEDLVNAVVAFKRPIYRDLAKELSALMAESSGGDRPQ